MIRVGVPLALLLLPLTAQAQDRQYRQLTLVDGRTLTAEILSTEATGLRLQLPQGETLVSFEVLLDMVPAEQVAYEAQTDWVVYVSMPEAYESEMIELIDAIPLVGAYPIPDGAGAVAGGLVEQDMVMAADCERDLDCIIGVVAGTPVKWIVTGEVVDGDLVIKSKLNTSSSPPMTTRPASLEREGMWSAAHQLLGLAEPKSPPPKPGQETTRRGDSGAWSEAKVLSSSFVPLPGYPSLAQGDGAGFALALGLVVPSTAVWVGAVGQSGQSPGEFAALSVAGFYVSTVLANQVSGLRSLNKGGGLVVAPTADGRGGTVAIGGAL